MGIRYSKAPLNAQSSPDVEEEERIAWIKKKGTSQRTDSVTAQNSDGKASGDSPNEPLSSLVSERRPPMIAGDPLYNASCESIGDERDIDMIRSNVVGNRCLIPTPFGARELVYADYTASGRALSFIEDYMLNVAAPIYANTHTEASLTGHQTTHLREEARDIIHNALKAPKEEYAVIFTGTGCTGAIDKLVRVLGFSIPEYADKKWNLKDSIPKSERPIVFISHFEHHSNELIWRESIAEVVVINENNHGFPDLEHLEQELVHFKDREVPLIGSFSAGSNVTGIRTDTRAITHLLHKYGAYAFFDFAGVAPYVTIDCYGGGGMDAMDAVFISPHKFIGGPGAAGLLVARRKFFSGALGVPTSKPSVPGGGTVSYVSQYDHEYAKDAETREDAGTPGIPQCIRAGLVFWTKEMVGSDVIERLESIHTVKALEAWKKHPRIALLGSDRNAYFDPDMRVPIFSFNILSPIVAESSSKFIGKALSMSSLCEESTHAREVLSLGCARMTPKMFHNMYSGNKFTLPLHQNFVIALLNDVYGIQGRGGCSCAGPYGHVLIGIGGEEGQHVSRKLLGLAVRGYEAFRPGWARLNLNYFISDDEADFIVQTVKQIASHGWKLLPLYSQDIKSGRYIHLSCLEKKCHCPFSLHDISLRYQGKTAELHYPVPICVKGERSASHYEDVLKKAMKLYDKAERDIIDFSKCQDFTSHFPDDVDGGDVWWLTAHEAVRKLHHLHQQRPAEVHL